MYSDSIAFAQYVLARYGGMVGAAVQENVRHEMECKKLEHECVSTNGKDFSTRIYLLTVAGDRIAPSTDWDMDLKITCYLYAGATCRRKVIQLLPALLDSSRFEWVNDPDGYKEYLTYELAKAFNGERIYQKAADLYELLYQQNPRKSYYAVGLIKALNSMGAFDTALQFVTDIKQSNLYKMTGKEYRALIEQENKNKEDEHLKKWGIKRSVWQRIKSYLFNKKHRIEPINRFREEIDEAEISIEKSIISARNRSDYEWILKNLPDICPKSFSGYMRMKNQNTKNFDKLVRLSLGKGRDIQHKETKTVLRKDG